MSRGNIVSQGWLEQGVVYFVVFEIHHGPAGTRTYIYDAAAGEAIENGADPKDFNGQLVANLETDDKNI
jgi:hypothetical protein